MKLWLRYFPIQPWTIKFLFYTHGCLMPRVVHAKLKGHSVVPVVRTMNLRTNEPTKISKDNKGHLFNLLVNFYYR